MPPRFSGTHHDVVLRKQKEAGVPGFEPGIADPKSAALPLGHTPTFFGFLPHFKTTEQNNARLIY
jgi:hypothetical protein